VHVARREVRAGALQRAQQPRVGVARELVVAVHEREVLPARSLRAGVARGAEAGVGLAQHLEARVALGEAAGDRGAAVGRAVVDDDDLEIALGLLRERPEALLQIGLDVVGRHDGADPRHGREAR
jgi:hypothetical protein